MSKFKVGDKVKIERAFESNMDGTYVSFNDEMPADIGKTGTIKSTSYSGKFFEVVTDGEDYEGGWWWHHSSLEFAEVENNLPELKSGMRVEVRNGNIFVVVKDLEKMFENGGFMPLKSYNSKGEFNSEEKCLTDLNWDIVKVFDGNTYSNFLNLDCLGDIIWEFVDKDKVAKQRRMAELEQIIANAKREINTLSEN